MSICSGSARRPSASISSARFRAARLVAQAERDVGAGMRAGQRAGAPEAARGGRDQHHLAFSSKLGNSSAIVPPNPLPKRSVSAAGVPPPRCARRAPSSAPSRARPPWRAPWPLLRPGRAPRSEPSVEVFPRLREKARHRRARRLRVAGDDGVGDPGVERQEDGEGIARQPVADQEADADQVAHLQQQVVVRRRRARRGGSADRRRWPERPAGRGLHLAEGPRDLGDLRVGRALGRERRRLRLDHPADLENLAEELGRRHRRIAPGQHFRIEQVPVDRRRARGCRCGSAIRAGPWPPATSPPRG